MNRISFSHHREKLLRIMKPNDLLIVASAPVAGRNSDVEFPYRQDSNMWYLTGFEEPNCIAVFIGGNPGYRLYRPDRDHAQERWTGARHDHDVIKRLHGIGSVEPLHRFADDLPQLLHGIKTLYWKMSMHPKLDAIIKKVIHRRSVELHNPDQLLAPLRLIKSPAELTALKHAAMITAKGFARAKQSIRPGLYEYQLKTELEYAFRYYGSVRDGYEPIVAGGAGTCVLHNPSDRHKLRPDDLVLIDAGAEWDYYTADVTRTYPVSGRFTNAQQLIYDIVLSTQEKAIRHVKPGIRWKELETITRKHMDEQLIKYNVITGTKPSPFHLQPSHSVFWHGLGHWLGIDVHDVGDRKAVFMPGMVLTIEPGIYIPRGTTGINRRYWNIGVRIEDDVVVTSSGHNVLTSMIPK